MFLNHELKCQDEDLGAFETIVPYQYIDNIVEVESGHSVTAVINKEGSLAVWHNMPLFRQNNVYTFDGFKNGKISFMK